MNWHHNDALIVAVASVALASSASAASYTWNVTTSGSQHQWNVADNWIPNDGGATFPSSAGDVANVNNDIEGGQTLRLRQDIRVGALHLGDSGAGNGTHAIGIANSTGESFSFIFDSGSAGVPATITQSSAGTQLNTFHAPVSLASALQIDLGGIDNANSQRLVFSGGLTTNGHDVTISGGIYSRIGLGLSGDLLGNGTITNNSSGSIDVSGGAKSFTGTIVLNGLAAGSNQNTLTLTNGSMANAAEIVVNGYLYAGDNRGGGGLHSGNNSSSSTNPGQRLTSNRITLNGGYVAAVGQSMNGAAQATLVEDTVANLDFNSGYSLIAVGANSASAGTRLNITTLERSAGASAFIRSGTLGDTARVIVGNADDFLVGGGGDEGTLTMSIIPWIVASNTNGSASAGGNFATYTSAGIRSLVAGEVTTDINAGADANIEGNNLGMTVDTTINSLRYNSGGTAGLNAGRILTVTSGGVSFAFNNGGIGGAGSPDAGTLNFGAAEGVIWANGGNVNGIGAVITGSGGLTKAGTGTLVLTGDNAYSGLTAVGGGTLQVGDGTNASDLGSGPVSVAEGTLLRLLNEEAIADDAILTLHKFGLSNGRIELADGLNEVVGGLFFGTQQQAFGTWGATGSGAEYINDDFFAGLGMLTVVPEPSAMMLLGLGLPMALRRRR